MWKPGWGLSHCENLRKGIVIWCGYHKQTPGGLRKSEKARVFRRKLMRRPIALRGDTTSFHHICWAPQSIRMSKMYLDPDGRVESASGRMDKQPLGFSLEVSRSSRICVKKPLKLLGGWHYFVLLCSNCCIEVDADTWKISASSRHLSLRCRYSRKTEMVCPVVSESLSSPITPL